MIQILLSIYFLTLIMQQTTGQSQCFQFEEYYQILNDQQLLNDAFSFENTNILVLSSNNYNQINGTLCSFIYYFDISSRQVLQIKNLPIYVKKILYNLDSGQLIAFSSFNYYILNLYTLEIISSNQIAAHNYEPLQDVIAYQNGTISILFNSYTALYNLTNDTYLNVKQLVDKTFPKLFLFEFVNQTKNSLIIIMHEDHESQKGIIQIWDPIKNEYAASISIKIGSGANNTVNAIQLPNTNLILINYKSMIIQIYDFTNIDQQKYSILSSYNLSDALLQFTANIDLNTNSIFQMIIQQYGQNTYLIIVDQYNNILILDLSINEQNNQSIFRPFMYYKNIRQSFLYPYPKSQLIFFINMNYIEYLNLNNSQLSPSYQNLKFNQLVYGSKKTISQNGLYFGLQIDKNLSAKSIVQENKYGNILVQYTFKQNLKIYDSIMSVQEVINLEKNVISFKIDQNMNLGVYFSQNNTFQIANADLGYNQSWSENNNFYKIIYISANQSLYFYQVNPMTNTLCKKKLDYQNKVEQFPLKSFQGIQPIFIIANDLNSVVTLTYKGLLVVYNIESLQIISFQQTNCNQVENGDYLKNLKIALFFCSQGNLIQYDLIVQTNKEVPSSIQNISSLAAINEINCVFIGEFLTGNIYGFKIKSQEDNTLINFIQIKTKLNYDILGFGYTNDELLFINTYPGNLYIDIKLCVQDQQICQICQTDFYFSNSQNLYPQLQNYGIGNTIYPFTASNNLITAFLQVNSLRFSLAQFNLINVNIYLDNQQQDLIAQYILDLPQPNQLNITLSTNKHSISQNRAEVAIKGNFIFKNFYQVSIINIQFFFPSINSFKCSLNLLNIQQLTLNNISIIGGDQEYNCFKINIYNSTATIKNTFLNNFNSINHPFLIQATNCDNITIDNMQLTNSEISNFQFLTQTPFTSLYLNNLLIKDNYCTSDSSSNSKSVSFFQSGQLVAKNVSIINNTFCNANIFEIKYQKNFQDIVNKIEYVSIYSNLIMTVLQTFLLDAQFQDLIQPDHQIDINNIYISQNEVLNFIEPIKKKGVNIFNFQNIKYININRVIFQNSQNIGLGIFQNAIELNIDQAKFFSDQDYQMTKMYFNSKNCFKIIDVQNITINQMEINQKSINNIDAVSIQINAELSKILIKDSIFTNNYFIQSQIDQSCNMFYISSSFQATIILQNITVSKNYFLGRPDTMVVSASGFIIDNQYGTILINNFSVNNFYTSSVYSPFSITASELLIQNSDFQNILQIDQLSDPQPHFFDVKANGIYRGGIFFLAVQYNLQIQESLFNNSNAIIGGLFYIESIYLNVTINDSIFQNGMAQEDGSVFYLKASFYLNLNIQNSSFSNFLNYGDQTSLFGLNLNQDQISYIQINNVKFRQIYGIQISYFINIQNCYVNISNVSIVEDLKALLNSYDLKFLQLIKSGKLSFSAVINSENSYIYVNEFSLKGIKTISSSLVAILFLKSQFSEIAMFNSYFQNCYFKEGGFGFVQNSNMTLENFNLENMTYLGSQKITQQTNYLFQSGYFLYLLDSSLLLNTSFINNIQCLCYCVGGFLQIQNFSYLLINNTTIKNATSYQGGALNIYYQDNNNLTIKNSTLIHNQAYYEGGAMYITIQLFQIKLNFEIDNIICKENISQNGEGGCLYASNPYYQLLANQTIFWIQNSNIRQNQAQVGGGIVYYEIDLQQNNTIVQNNNALLYGDNIYSLAKKIKYVNGSFSQDVEVIEIGDSLYLKNIQSGFEIYDLQFQLVNEFNQVVSNIEKYQFRYDYYQKLSIYFNYNQSNSTYILTTTNKNNNMQPQYNSISKTFDLQNIKLQAFPQQTINFNLTSDGISNKISYNKQNDSYSYQIYISVVNCIIGYIPDKSTKIMPTCLPCYEGTYSFDSLECQKCPNGAYCKGNSDLEVLTGYWRKNKLDDQIIQCQIPYLCIGGKGAGNQLCQPGYIGATCLACDSKGFFWGKKYINVDQFTCIQCSQQMPYIIKLIFIYIWVIFVIYFIVSSYNRILRQEILNQVASAVTKKNIVNKVISDKIGVYLKVINNYFQNIFIYSTFSSKYLKTIFTFQHSVALPILKLGQNLECFLKEIKTEVPLCYLRATFSLITPAILIIGFITIKSPDILYQFFNLFSCTLIGSTYYLNADYSLECYNKEYFKHLYTFIFPSIFVFALVIPSIFFVILNQNKTNLNKVSFKLAFGFMYLEYKEKYFYWECLKMAQKTIFMFIISFLNYTPLLQGYFIIVFLMIYMILCYRNQPYISIELTRIDYCQTLITSISILLILFIQQNQVILLEFFAFGCIFSLNCCLSLIIFQKLFVAIVEMNQQFFIKLTNKCKLIQCVFKLLKIQLKQEEPVLKNNSKQQRRYKILQSIIEFSKISENYSNLIKSSQVRQIQNLNCLVDESNYQQDEVLDQSVVKISLISPGSPLIVNSEIQLQPKEEAKKNEENYIFLSKSKQVNETN
ncbi:hypothetical protein ABPG72_016632 [Tetrahymena utriculariae]